MPLIIPANTLATGGYEVANSCRFNFADGAYLTKTFGASGNQKTFTLSNWIKRSRLGDLVMLYGGAGSDAIYFTTSDELLVICGSGSDDRRISTMKFRDVGAWYHIVQKFDTTQGTAADRYTLYVNGTVAATTVVSGKNEITQDLDINLFYNAASYISFDGSSDYFDGYMAETVHIDGTALAASSFGEFDEDSPTIWKPIDVSGLTFGTNGFYLDYEDSGDLGDDESGNTNDFTENNLAATDQATDSPTNNFATMNPLDNYISAATFSEGNLKLVGTSTYTFNTSTFALTAGKWYMEAKCTDHNNSVVGIVDHPSTSTSNEIGYNDNGWEYKSSNGQVRGGASAGTLRDTYNTYGDGDIIGVYLDLDNNKLYYAKNGTLENSGTGLDITAVASTTNGHYFIACGKAVSATGTTWEMNFGSPTFSLSSAVADKNGYGSFEYNPSSGTFDGSSKDFLAICTKNLGSDGG